MKLIRGSQIPFLPASHEDPKDPGVLKRVLADRDDLQAGQVMMVNWSRLPVGKSFRNHYHEDLQEIFVMISGVASMAVGDQTFRLEAGDAMVVEPRETHRMTNRGAEDVEYLVFGISNGEGGKTVVIEPE